MTKHGKKSKPCLYIFFLVILFICFSFSTGGQEILAAGEGEENLLQLQGYLLRSIEWSKDNNGLDSSVADWYAIGIGRTGREEREEYRKILQKNITTLFADEKKWNDLLPTDFSRMVLVMKTFGENPLAIKGENTKSAINLIKKNPVYTSDMSENLPANQYIWSLISLNAATANERTKEADRLIEKIFTYQNNDGSFGIGKSDASVDITGMVLQAFAPFYQSDRTMKEKLDKTLSWLSDCQKEKGDFSESGEQREGTLESTVQVMIGLCSLDINPARDKRFVKNSYTLVNGFLQYRTGDGSFAHTVEEKDNRINVTGKGNEMATSQAICAMTALYRYSTGQNALYDFSGENTEDEKDIFQITDVKNPLILQEDFTQDSSTMKEGEDSDKDVQNRILYEEGQKKRIRMIWILAGICGLLIGTVYVVYRNKKKKEKDNGK